MNEDRRPESTFVEVLAAVKEPRILLGAAVSVLLFLSITYLPFVGLFFGALTPVPLYYYYYRRGRVYGLTMAGLALIAVYLLFSSMGAPKLAMAYLEYALLALVLGETSRWGLTPGRVIGSGALAVITLGLVMLVMTAPGQGESIWEHGRAALEEQVRASLELYGPLMDPAAREGASPDAPAGTDPGSAAVSPETDVAAKLTGVLVAVFPGLAVIGTVLLAWVNFLAGRVLILKSGTPWPPALTDLTVWRSPDWVVWVLIGAGFGSFVLGGFNRLAAINTLMVVGLIYFFQGLSVMAHWMDQKAVPPFFRGLIYFLIVAQQYLALVVAAIGVFDLWADFRKLKAAQNGEQ